MCSSFLLFGIDSNSQYEKVQTNLPVIFHFNFMICNACFLKIYRVSILYTYISKKRNSNNTKGLRMRSFTYTDLHTKSSAQN